MKEGAAAAAARDNVAALAAWEAALETARELKEPPRIIAVLERMGLAAADLPDGLAMASQCVCSHVPPPHQLQRRTSLTPASSRRRFAWL